MRCGGTPEPVQAPPAVVFDEVTNGYVPWSMSRNVPCAPSNNNVRAVADLFVQEHDGVLDERLQILAGFIVFRKNLLERKRFRAERFEHGVVFLDARCKLHFELGGINQIIHAQTDARRLVAVSRADAALGRADLVFALEQFARAVQFAVIRKHNVRRLAQHKILRA